VRIACDRLQTEDTAVRLANNRGAEPDAVPEYFNSRLLQIRGQGMHIQARYGIGIETE
jgi:hypothetical protein